MHLQKYFNGVETVLTEISAVDKLTELEEIL